MRGDGERFFAALRMTEGEAAGNEGRDRMTGDGERFFAALRMTMGGGGE